MKFVASAFGGQQLTASTQSAAALFARARVSRNAGRSDEAQRDLSEALTLIDFNAIDGRRQAAEIRLEIAELHNDEQRYQRAMCTAQRAFRGLERYGGAARLQARAQACLGMAAWYSPAGVTSSLRHYLAANTLAASDASVRPDQLVHTSSAIGLCWHNLGEIEKAVATYQDALALAERSGLVGQLTHLRRRLANALQDVGLFHASSELMALIRPPDDAPPDDLIAWHNPAAMLAEQTDNFELALSHYETAIAAFEEPGPHRARKAAVLTNAALLYLDFGDAGRAGELLAQHQTVLNDQSPLGARLGACRVRSRLAQLDGASGCAIEALKDAIGILDQQANGSPILRADFDLQIAELQWASGDADAALETLGGYVARARTSGLEPHEVAPAVMAARILLETGRIGEAVSLLRPAFCAELGRRQLETEWRLFALLADWAEVTGKHAASIVFGKVAVTTICQSIALREGTTSEQRSLLAARLAPFVKLSERLAAAGRIPEAMSVVALLKSERLFQFASRDVPAIQRQTQLPLRDNERELLDRHRALAEESARIRLDRLLGSPRGTSRGTPAPQIGDEVLNSAEQLLSDMLDMGRVGINTTTPNMAPSVDGHDLPHGTALARMIAGRDRIAVEILSRDASMTFAVQMPLNALAALVLDFRRRIETQSPDVREPAALLYDILLRPAEHVLDSCARLNLVCEGLLSHVPFPALHDGHGYLIERMSVATQTGIKRTPRAKIDRKQWLVAAFAATKSVASLPALDHARAEIETVKRLHSKTKALYDDEFNRAALEAALSSRPQLLHLASHYHLHVAAAHRSHFILGDGSVLPLTAFRDPRLDLSSLELVVLAGCDTGTSEVGDNGLESVAGLAQLRGARDILATLWAVADIGASRLMCAFYEHLFRSDPAVDAAEALRAAQVEMLTNAGPTLSLDDESRVSARGLGRRASPMPLDHPRYWAGYTLFVGDHDVRS
ncbi:MAG: CHAT domain-containing protein [Hyphomicrobiaceae bacterium]|nr:CHAT domain-containing protein [Hyphomicrobiaceae bacterium]